MKDTLTRQGVAERYTFDRPAAPPVSRILNTFTGIKYVFGDPARFKNIYEVYGYGSFLMFDEAEKYVPSTLSASIYLIFLL
jgi:linoleate 10R-lipoxygenase